MTNLKKPVFFFLISIFFASFFFYSGCQSPQKEITLTVEQLLQAERILSFLNRSRIELEANNYDNALILADSAESYAPYLAAVYFLHGLIYDKLGRIEDAQAAYEKTLSIDPNFEGACANLGELSYNQDLYRLSLGFFQKELEIKPRSEVWVSVGLAYANLYRPDSAEWAYSKAIALDSSNAPAYMLLGVLYRDNGNPEQALRYLQWALELNPDETTYKFVLGSLLYQTGRLEEAIGYLRAATAQRPWHYGSHYNLGMALTRLGHDEAGQRYLERANTLQELQGKISRVQRKARLQPDSVETWITLADAFHTIGRIDRALENYKIALTLEPGNLMLYDNIAYLYMLMGDETNAVLQYKTILKYDSTRSNTWFNLGLIHANMGRTKNAREAWNTALLYNPADSTTRAFLNKLPDKDFIMYLME